MRCAWLAGILGLTALPVLAAGIAGNGGDLAACRPGAENTWSGYYTLDYLMGMIYQTEHAGDFAAVVGPAAPYDANIDRLIEATSVLYPRFSSSLADYKRQLFLGDLGNAHVWKIAPFGLPPVDDENLIVVLPPNCLREGTSSPFDQAVYRVTRSSTAQIEYFYEPRLIAAIADRPLQMSFLLLHEWLWGFADDAEIVRSANAVLHARDWSLAAVDRRMAELAAVGLRLPDPRGAIAVVDVALGSDRTVVVQWNGERVASENAAFVLARTPGTRLYWRVQNGAADYVYFSALDAVYRGTGFIVAPGETHAAFGGPGYCVAPGDRFLAGACVVRIGGGVVP